MQFSIRSLLAMTVVASVFSCVFFALPDAVTPPAIVALYLTLLPVSVAGLVYGRGGVRAFWLGCSTVVVPIAMWFVEGRDYMSLIYYQELSGLYELTPEELREFRIHLGVLFGSTLLFGGLSAAVYRWLSRPSMAAARSGIEGPDVRDRDDEQRGSAQRTPQAPGAALVSAPVRAFIGVALAAGAVLLVFGVLTPPAVNYGLLALWLAPIPVSIAGVVYGSGYWRAFALGSLSMCGMLLFGLYVVLFYGGMILPGDADPAELETAKVLCGGILVATCMSGLLAIAVRWLCGASLLHASVAPPS